MRYKTGEQGFIFLRENRLKLSLCEIVSKFVAKRFGTVLNALSENTFPFLKTC